MANQLPPIPREPVGDSFLWREWFYNLGRYIQIVNAGGTAWTVPQGGTGGTVFTGYLKGNGISSFTASSTIPYTDIANLSTGYVPYTGATAAVDLGVYGITAKKAILGPGTASAGTAPLKFTEGTVMTTPEVGAVECNFGHIYYSPIANVRYAMAMASGVKTTTTTVVNTVTETTIYSYTFAANELHNDEHVELYLTGVYSNASATDDFTLRFKLGGTTIATVARAAGNVTNQGWKANFDITTRSIGAGGTYVNFVQYTDGVTNNLSGVTTPQSIDTTVTNIFEVTVQWANAKAGNTFSCTQGVITFKD